MSRTPQDMVGQGISDGNGQSTRAQGGVEAMSRNSAFGRRIQMVRRQLSMELPRLAELGPIASGRLELIELGQLDDTDLNPDELARLSNVLNCSVDYLVCGYDKVPGFQGYTVGNRARGDQFQEELHLEPK